MEPNKNAPCHPLLGTVARYCSVQGDVAAPDWPLDVAARVDMGNLGVWVFEKQYLKYEIYHLALKADGGGMDDGPDQDPMVPSSRVIVVPSLLSQRRQLSFGRVRRYLGTCRRLLSACTSVADPVARRCNVVVCLLHTALRRRPRVGAASECVRPSRPPIEAVTVLSRVRTVATSSPSSSSSPSHRFARTKIEIFADRRPQPIWVSILAVCVAPDASALSVSQTEVVSAILVFGRRASGDFLRDFEPSSLRSSPCAVGTALTLVSGSTNAPQQIWCAPEADHDNGEAHKENVQLEQTGGDATK
ncbi:hypothetical protein M5K25_018257 [Dendrobium thyrsiflorum]|uniref:Uncharacterized protein n=1 Tax=Dendrobium thyrsiflorum TaxID=117978 RepID=A0ABD0UI68_DENTH